MDGRIKKGIAVAGTILVDTIHEISDYPQEGELTKIIKNHRSVGGCVSNVAIGLKRIDPELSVMAVGKVGDDENGRFATDFLVKNGVDIGNISILPGESTSFTEVMSVKGGQRTFFTYGGASDDFGEADVNLDQLDSRILHIGYFLLLKKIDGGEGREILKKAQKKGIKTSIDLVSENSDRYALVRPCLPFTDYLIINELEAGRLADMDPMEKNLKKIANRLKSMGVREKVIIHFRDGAVCCSEEGFSSLGSYRLPEGYTVGTTGAGDAFCAGALIGIYKGLGDKEILEYGSMSAAMALRTADATGGLVREEEMKAFCKKFDRVELCL